MYIRGRSDAEAGGGRGCSLGIVHERKVIQAAKWQLKQQVYGPVRWKLRCGQFSRPIFAPSASRKLSPLLSSALYKLQALNRTQGLSEEVAVLPTAAVLYRVRCKCHTYLSYPAVTYSGMPSNTARAITLPEWPFIRCLTEGFIDLGPSPLKLPPWVWRCCGDTLLPLGETAPTRRSEESSLRQHVRKGIGWLLVAIVRTRGGRSESRHDTLTRMRFAHRTEGRQILHIYSTKIHASKPPCSCSSFLFSCGITLLFRIAMPTTSFHTLTHSSNISYVSAQFSWAERVKVPACWHDLNVQKTSSQTTHLSSPGYSRSNNTLVLTPVSRRFPSFDHTRLLPWLPRGRETDRFRETKSVVHDRERQYGGGN